MTLIQVVTALNDMALRGHMPQIRGLKKKTPIYKICLHFIRLKV